MKRISLWLAVAVVTAIAIVWYGTGDDDPLPTAPPSAQQKPIEASAPASTAQVQTSSDNSTANEASANPKELATSTSKPLPKKSLDDYVDWQDEIIDGLVGMGDPDSLVAAAMLLHERYGNTASQSVRIRELLANAIAGAPGDKTLIATALRICNGLYECQYDAYATTLREIDATNMLGFLFRARTVALPASAMAPSGDIRAESGLFLYQSDILRRSLSAISRTPTTPRFAPPNDDLWVLYNSLALRAVNALQVPKLGEIARTCQDERTAIERGCAIFGRRLSKSDVMDIQWSGVRLITTSKAYGGSITNAAVAADAYLNQVSQAMQSHAPPTTEWVHLLSTNDTELGAARAWLKQFGFNSSPPVWLR